MYKPRLRTSGEGVSACYGATDSVTERLIRWGKAMLNS